MNSKYGVKKSLCAVSVEPTCDHKIPYVSTKCEAGQTKLSQNAETWVPYLRTTKQLTWKFRTVLRQLISVTGDQITNGGLWNKITIDITIISITVVTLLIILSASMSSNIDKQHRHKQALYIDLTRRWLFQDLSKFATYITAVFFCIILLQFVFVWMCIVQGSTDD